MKLAFIWYERQRRGFGFGFEFLGCVENSIHSIIENPVKFRILYDQIRGRVIRRFPFSIFYSIEGQVIVVHAVFDNRHDPEKKP